MNINCNRVKKTLWTVQETQLLQWVVFNYCTQSKRPVSQFVNIDSMFLENYGLGKDINISAKQKQNNMQKSLDKNSTNKKS